jgi:hypothetical protein
MTAGSGSLRNLGAPNPSLNIAQTRKSGSVISLAPSHADGTFLILSVAHIRKRRCEFELWCDGVARPVFSAFVLQLEAAGRRARVIVRTGAVESMKSAPRLLGSNYNPSGYIRISFQEYGNGWWMDTALTECGVLCKTLTSWTLARPSNGNWTPSDKSMPGCAR